MILNTTSELFARYCHLLVSFCKLLVAICNLYPVIATTVSADLSKVVINLTNFFAMPGIRTQIRTYRAIQVSLC